MAAVAVVLVVVFSDDLEKSAGWLRLVLLPGIVIASVSASASGGQLRGIGRARMIEIFESTLWLKVWLGLCGMAAAGFAIYAVRNGVDLHRVGVLRFLVVSFVAVLGPFVVVSERERFRKLGEDGDGIL